MGAAQGLIHHTERIPERFAIGTRLAAKVLVQHAGHGFWGLDPAGDELLGGIHERPNLVGGEFLLGDGCPLPGSRYALGVKKPVESRIQSRFGLVGDYRRLGGCARSPFMAVSSSRDGLLASCVCRRL